MIKNSVSVNKQRSVEELNQIIVKLTKEISQLKNYIQGLGHSVPKALDSVVITLSFFFIHFYFIVHSFIFLFFFLFLLFICYFIFVIAY